MLAIIAEQAELGSEEKHQGELAQHMLAHLLCTQRRTVTGLLNTLVIIEFKKPGRTEYSKSKYLPLPQIQRYVKNIREGRIKDKNGRRIPMSQGTPVYAYVLCDIVPELEAQLGSLQPSDDHRMFFGHHPGIGGWIQVVDYAKVIEDARKRSRILFDKLNLPVS